MEQTIYNLMLKDRIVMTIDVTDGTVKIEDERLLPFDFHVIDQPILIADRLKNLTSFQDWCAGRTLMMSQKHAKSICNALAISQDISTENKANIALAYHCSTLQDAYWIKKNSENLSYNNVSLFCNTSRNLLTPVSLKGQDSIFTKKLKNWSDIGTDGTLAKSWIRENGKYYLHKESDNTNGEILAGIILNLMGFHSVKYERADEDGLHITKCPCFTSEDMSFIPYRTFAKKYKENAIKIVKEIVNNTIDFLKISGIIYLETYS